METELLPLYEPSFRYTLNLIIVGALLWLVLAIARKILSLTHKSNDRQVLVRRWLPLIESIAWAHYVGACLVAMVLPNLVIGGGIALVIIVAGWSFIRNFISGLIVRLQGNIREGQRLMLDGKQGELTRMNLSGIEITLEKGETLMVPYLRLLQEEVIQPNPSDKIKSRALEMIIPTAISKKEGVQLLQNAGLNLPWAVATKVPVVDFLENTPEGNRFRVVVYAIHTDHFNDMERQLLDLLAGIKLR